MPDIDKWSATFQWIATFGVALGAAVAGFFGIRVARSKPPVDDTDDADRRAERRRLFIAEAQVREDALRADFQKVIEAVREPLARELQRQERERSDAVADLQRQIHRLEVELARRGPPRG